MTITVLHATDREGDLRVCDMPAAPAQRRSLLVDQAGVASFLFCGDGQDFWTGGSEIDNTPSGRTEINTHWDRI